MIKLDYLKKLIQKSQLEIALSTESWKNFLAFAAQIYKYDYTSALLCYAQNPDAKTLAQADIWQRVGRTVNDDAKPVYVIEDAGNLLRVSCIYDVSDTSGSPETIPMPWQLPKENRLDILQGLEDRYHMGNHDGIFDQRLQGIIESAVQESYNLYSEEIFEMLKATSLEKLDDIEIDSMIQEFLTDSITYMVYCRLDPASPILKSLIFDGLPLFQPQTHLSILGTATVKHSSDILRHIETAIKQRRTQDESHRKDITERTSGQIRDKIQEVSGGNAARPIRDSFHESGSDGTLPADGAGSERIRGNSADKAAQRNTPAENREHNGADSVQQLVAQNSGGNHAERHRLPEIEQSEQGAVSDEAVPSPILDTLNGEDAYLAFVSEEDFRDIYLFSALTECSQEHRQVIYNFYLSNPKASDATKFLKNLEGIHGSSITFRNGYDGFYFFNGKGLELSVRLPEGDYHRTASWSVVQKEIRTMIAEGRYLIPEPVQQPQQLSLFDAFVSSTPAKASGKTGSTSDFDEQNPDVLLQNNVANLEQSEEHIPTPLTLPTKPILIKSVPTNNQSPQIEHQTEIVAAFKQGEFVRVPWGEEDLQGKILTYGNQSVTLFIGPYSWSVQVIERDYFDLHAELTQAIDTQAVENLSNFHYSDTSELTGGQKTHYKDNVQAIILLKRLENEHRWATPEEQCILSRYVGWGGISQAFDGRNDSWTKEYQELKQLLTPEEYTAARASTLTAFYTPPAVIQAIHAGLVNFGFTGGNISEPACGIGRFFGHLPADIEKNSKLYGVELDSITGRIAQQLYQNADIQIKGYEKAVYPDNFFDVSIGNVPFGEFKVSDTRYDKMNLLIHDYFFIKALDKTRPGGLLTFVTSKGTMDKANDTVRRYIAQRAELIGAIRLPNTMMKAEANTEVTTDIIFLQKREKLIDAEPEWIHLAQTEDGVPVNSYFADHPEMMLGKMVYSSNMYGNAKDTALISRKDSDWRNEIMDAITKLQATYSEPIMQTNAGSPEEVIPATPEVKNFSFTIVDDRIYFRENSQMIKRDFTGIREQRVRGMIEIRKAMREVIRVQSNDFPEKAIQDTQAELNHLYDDYVKKYGYLTDKGNRIAFSEDSDYPLLCSLESINEDGAVQKAAIFTKRTIRQPHNITHVDTALEALPLCLNEKGKLDLSYISKLTGKTKEQVVEELGGTIYKDPIEGNYVTADDYLSGNVRQKLSIAQAAAAEDAQYQINVEALTKVQPKDIDASQIDIRLGSPLLDTDEIRQFVLDTLEPPVSLQKFKVIYVPSEALWKVNGVPHSLVGNNVKATKNFGTHRMNAYELLEQSLNQKSPTIRDRKEDNTYVVNPKETAAAREKQKALERKFEDWIFRDPERRERLTRKYNDIYNNIRLRQYDGSYLTFPGMTPEINLRPHQRNAVARILNSGNALLAHCVGAGKTYTMVTAAMEGKRLGLWNKSMFVVPGHLLEQWANDFLTLYPGAKILIATKQDFERIKRQRLISRIALSDIDAVIIANTSFEKIPVSPERQERIIQEQIASLEDAMDLALDENDEDWTIKQMERTKKTLQERLERLSDQSRKDDLLTFEELGVDQLFVDEAHYYKNLFIPTKMTNVAGISSSHAIKSTDLLIKIDYLSELHHKQMGVVFATGTPVSNSMAELFVMMRYLEYDKLVELGLQHFDAWAAQFGRKVASLELTPDGTQYRYKTRFAEFVNLPELMNLYSLVADIQTAEMLKLPVPALKGGKAQIIVAKPSTDQLDLVDDIIECFEKIHNGAVEPWEDNALKETHRGRCGALDMRVLDPSYEDFEGSKINLAVKNIFDIWQQSSAKKSTQMIFCDLSTPKMIKMEVKDGVAEMAEAPFSVYDDIKTKLEQKGIPKHEIAFIHQAKTDKQKESLFADMRAGRVRILLGSTTKMGAGTNAQRKIVAIHHLDCPWRPGDLEQRNGRAFRQGNENDEVAEYRYVTEGTFDAYSWQILEQKQKFIGQVSTGQCIERHAKDIDETVLDYATVKMLSTNDPRIKQREELRVRVSELYTLKAQYNSERYAMEDDFVKYLPQKVLLCKQTIRNFERDRQSRNAETKPDFVIELFGKQYDKRKIAGEIILQKAKSYFADGEYFPIGHYRGFDLELTYSLLNRTHILSIKGAARHNIDLGEDPLGCIARMDNILNDMEKVIENNRKSAEYAQQQLTELKAQLDAPWEHELELTEKAAQLEKLDIELSQDMNKGGNAYEETLEVDNYEIEEPEMEIT